MIYIAPSILTSDFSNLTKEIKRLEAAKVDLLHIDVMDGIFVPNITIGPVVIKSLRKKTSLLFDVHLMISEPIRYLENFKDSGADIITVHQEACKNLELTIEKIKKLEAKVGIAINPDTSFNTIKKILPEVDLVLLMTVNPGFGGQSFIKSVVTKIKLAKKQIEKIGKKIDIEVDGGICKENIKEVTSAGANILVMGSALFSKKNIKNEVIKIRQILKNV